ncbi:hypothetical protein IEQ11_14080 [Lysobacter capsici]|uniref:hypothetical protein n=1 Tax=Lysobacter capsici TaxID=435897 RepID=UPI001E2921BE|nr:hypothetical protein [Lysobacter capsici]UOF12888.1 hypothetical protein IEQ11_14080 [Lysobacter capsici]
MSRLAQLRLLSMAALGLIAPCAQALDWSSTELQWQRGRLELPYSDNASAQTTVWTFQHANGWKYGDNFGFIDFSRGRGDLDAYGEYYGHFSLGKIRGAKTGWGPVKDIGLLAGVNAAEEAKVLKYLPGLRLSLDAPGFAFLNLDITAYLDDSRGVRHGGAPKEGDSWMVDLNGARAFKIGKAGFSIEGHIEYVAARRDEFGQRVPAHVLAQPQIRYDLGERLWGWPNQVFVGVEYQYWRNKLGDANTDESAIQALVVWRL